MKVQFIHSDILEYFWEERRKALGPKPDFPDELKNHNSTVATPAAEQPYLEGVTGDLEVLVH